MKSLVTQAWTGVTLARNWLYDTGVLDSVSLPLPVISIGNLSMGGSGKTPVVAWLAQSFIHSRKRPLIVARNYKAQCSAVSRVEPWRKNSATWFGDEPTWLAENLPEAMVWVGPKKFLTARQAIRIGNPQVVLVDDGFQHRALKRDLDLVCLDASLPLEKWKVFPSGVLREEFSALRRADFVLLTKCEAAGLEQLHWLKSQIPEGLPWAESEQVAHWPLPPESSGAIWLLAGIARPESFFSMVRARGYHVCGTTSLPDHGSLSEPEMRDLVTQAKRQGAQRLWVTAKDFVKLRWWLEENRSLDLPIESVEISLRFREGEGALRHALAQICP